MTPQLGDVGPNTPSSLGRRPPCKQWLCDIVQAVPAKPFCGPHEDVGSMFCSLI